MPDEDASKPDELDLSLPAESNPPEVKVEKTIKGPEDMFAALAEKLGGGPLDKKDLRDPEKLFGIAMSFLDATLTASAAKDQADIAWKSNMGDQVQSLKTLLIAPDGRNRLDVINANLHVLYEVLTNPKYQTIKKVGP